MKINYTMPIHWESIAEGATKAATIKGVAISAMTSRNNVTYEVEELEKAYASLMGKNISVGHDDSPENNVGFIEDVDFDGKNVNFLAKVMNTAKYPDAVDMVKRKLWQHVSVEAMVKSMEEKGNKVTAKGLEFTGLAFVKTPGIENANVAGLVGMESFAAVIAESFKGENMELKEEVEYLKAELEKLKKEQTRARSEAVISADMLTENVVPVLKNPSQHDIQCAAPGTLIMEGAGGPNCSFWIVPKTRNSANKNISFIPG